MGAPPSDDQIAEMLSNPMVAQTMNEALSNPNFIDFMIRSNPQLAAMPNAREMLQSPHFREMMTNPEAIRMAARMRSLLHGGGQGAAFPAPGATDTTPAGAAAAGGSAAAGNGGNDDLLRGLFGAPGAGNLFAPGAANPFASLLGIVPPGGPSSGATTASQTPATSTQTPASSENREGSAGSSTNTQGQAGQPPNPFSALLGLGAGQPGAQGSNANNPFSALLGLGAGQPGAQGSNANANNPFGWPPHIPPEALRQLFPGVAPAASAAPAPPDNRPPEERYAEQLRQLNDMGFFDFDKNVTALRRSGGSVQGAVEYLLSNP
jgi:ubiquilin